MVQAADLGPRHAQQQRPDGRQAQVTAFIGGGFHGHFQFLYGRVFPIGGDFQCTHRPPVAQKTPLSARWFYGRFSEKTSGNRYKRLRIKDPIPRKPAKRAFLRKIREVDSAEKPVIRRLMANYW